MFTDVPKPIAINEAIELAKAYDTDDAPAFINGILNAVGKTLGEKKE
jgi:N utilization substance protein B